MTSQQAYEKLISLSNLDHLDYMKDARACQVYLKRTRGFLKYLGDPQNKYKIIHLAGTSGKGSVTTMLANILDAAGHKVGSYTSPHITTYLERVQINGKFISRSQFVTQVKEVVTAYEKYLKKESSGPLSYFELFTCLGLHHFAKEKVKYVILEAGCGGRFDATNVIGVPVMAIVTNIGLDHTHILGDTKTKIARKKAGIFKKNGQAVTGERNPKILKVIKREAKLAGTTLMTVPKPTAVQTDIKGTHFKIEGQEYNIPLPGKHQAENAAIAIKVASQLKIDQNSITQGLAHSRIPARFEIISQKPIIILDGAHNQDKITSTLYTLNSLPYKRLHVVCGFVANKDWRPAVKKLATRAKTLTATRFSTTFRKVADPAEIAKTAQATSSRFYLDPQEALKQALGKVKPDDALLITGSLYLAGELRNFWVPSKKAEQKRTAWPT